MSAASNRARSDSASRRRGVAAVMVLRSWRAGSFLRQAQGVADTADRVNQRRRPCVDGIDLLAQIADVGLEHSGVATEVVVPDVVEQLGPREHLARVRQQ